MTEPLSAPAAQKVVAVPVAVIDQWRKDWLDENDPKDGTDCVTPFDEYLYRSPVSRDALDRLIDFTLSDDSPVGPEDEADVARADPTPLSTPAAQGTVRKTSAEMIAYHRFALHEDGNTAEVDSGGLAEEIDKALSASPSPEASPAGVDVGELGRDDLKRRAVKLLGRNDWKPGSQFSAHSTTELMVALATDAVKNPPDRCGWPECGCCHDASCNEAHAPSPEALPASGVELRKAAERVIAEGRIASGGIRRPAKWIQVPAATWSALQAALTSAPAPEDRTDRNPAYDGPMGCFEGYGEEP